MNEVKVKFNVDEPEWDALQRRTFGFKIIISINKLIERLKRNKNENKRKN